MLISRAFARAGATPAENCRTTDQRTWFKRRKADTCRQPVSCAPSPVANAAHHRLSWPVLTLSSIVAKSSTNLALTLCPSDGRDFQTHANTQRIRILLKISFILTSHVLGVSEKVLLAGSALGLLATGDLRMNRLLIRNRSFLTLG